MRWPLIFFQIIIEDMTLLLFIALFFPNHSLADQNAPSQFSPVHQPYLNTMEEHLTPSPKFKPLTENKMGSTVTLSWLPIPNAAYYFVIVSQDADLHDVAFSQNTTAQQLLTSELSPGQYYYVVRGYNKTNLVGESKLDRFVIGSPLQITSGKTTEKLPAPQIAGPNSETEHASYSPIRFTWSRIDGARGYRYRLWEIKEQPEEPKHNRHAFEPKKTLVMVPEGPPRWVTEVTENWIEVRDAPYSSYMYLDTGNYRWDVAAVDKKTGRVGETAFGTFKVNRYMHLPETQTDLRFSNRLFPSATYSQTSAASRETFQKNAVRDTVGIEMDRFWNRRMGIRTKLDFDFFDLVSSVYIAPSISSDFIYRTHLSPLPLGADVFFRGGLELFRLPHLESAGGVITETLTSIGPRIGIDFEQKMEIFLFQTGITLMLPVYLSAPTYGGASLYPTLNYNLYARGLFKLSQSSWSLGPELTLQHRNLKFSPFQSDLNTNVGWSNNFSIGAVLQYRSRD